MYESDDDEMIYLLRREFEDLGRYDNVKNPVATTWLISFRHLSSLDPLAADYLRLMSVLAERDIPRSLLPHSGKARMVDALGTLKSYAFITEREGLASYDIHRLVHVSARHWLKERGEWNVWTTKALQQVAEMFPHPDQENRDLWIIYLPHAQSVLNVRKDADDEKAERDVLSVVGEAFNALGKYPEAETLHQQALALRERTLGIKHPDTLASMNNLGVTLRLEGKYQNSEQIHRRTLVLRESTLGTEHPDTLTSMDNLASVLDDQDKFQDAEQIHRQTLKLRKNVLHENHPAVFKSMNGLASVLYHQEKNARRSRCTNRHSS